MQFSLNFNPETLKAIYFFLQEKLKETKTKGFVIGLSGGVDSAVVSKLCVNAIRKEKVLCIFLPEKATPKDDYEDVKKFAKSLGVKFKIANISEIVSKISELIKVDNLKARANLKARIRMAILFSYANSLNYLVAGTSNKSELLIGYFTKFGDGASDLLPIGDLYKTQVWQLANLLEIPKNIIKKTPTAGLIPNQTDEGELGIKYEILDKILFGIELKLSNEEIAKKVGIAKKEVVRIDNLVKITSHKRRFPPIPKIGARTLGVDWRE